MNTTYYRVSLKALIRNSKNEALLVKEHGDKWSLPGGGIEHGETVHQALARELYEECKITAPFTEKVIGIETMPLVTHDVWLMWAVYEISIADGFEFGVGEDATDIAFIDPEKLKDGKHRAGKLTYKYMTR